MLIQYNSGSSSSSLHIFYPYTAAYLFTVVAMFIVLQPTEVIFKIVKVHQW